MYKKTKPILILLNFILVLLLTSLSAFKEENYKNRDGFYLKLAPVDPRSLMQGDYMVLNYEIVDEAWNKIYEIQEKENKTIKNGFIVVEINKDNVAVFKDVVRQVDNNENLLYIAFKSNGYKLRINADSFFFQEGNAHLYEKAKYSKVVLIKNTLRLIDLVNELPKKT